MTPTPKNAALWVAHAYVLRELLSVERCDSPEWIVANHTALVALRAAEAVLRTAVVASWPSWPPSAPSDVDVACARLVQAAGVRHCGSYGADYAPVEVPDRW